MRNNFIQKNAKNLINVLIGIIAMNEHGQLWKKVKLVKKEEGKDRAF